MTKSIYIHLVFMAICLTGCISPRVATIWKAESTAPIRFHNIMIAAIPSQKDDSLRVRIESSVVESIANLGYYTISSIREFGPYGFKSLDEEATYLTLCDNGIDAVLTFALVEESYGRTLDNGTGARYTNAYYYNRIWNYKKLQAETMKSKQPDNSRYTWEVILFDLATLQPQCVMQSKPMTQSDALRALDIITNRFVKKMLKDKIITRQNTPKLKPF